MGEPTAAEAIKRRLVEGPRTQSWLGARVAELLGRPDPFSQAAVSQWLNGGTITSEVMFAIEEAFEMKPGTLSALEGYLPTSARPARTVLDAIDADNTLTREQQETLAEIYETLRARTRARRLAGGSPT